MNKTKHLAVYDYGQGGTWLFVLARSADDITSKYHELKVVSDRPSWLKGDHLKAVEARTFDIDEAPKGWLETLVKGRKV